MSEILLAASQETGTLGIKHLKRFWSKARLGQGNALKDDLPDEWALDKALLSALGLGLEPTMIHLYGHTPSFSEFENWIVEIAGPPSAQTVSRFNSIFTGKEKTPEDIPAFFSKEEMAFWEEHGYIIIRNAISKEDCEQTIDLICDHINVQKDDPKSWYTHHPARQGIMVQLFNDPILERNRQSEKIRQAFEQLWQRRDIWVTTDRVGFNPPETDSWKYPGQGLHWDCNLELPIPFSLQGILYLADTAANQGAFTLVPGFHNRMESWLKSLPRDQDPGKQDLHALGSMPIAANAGDFIIWHQALPHGSSPNTSDKPRFVQYIKYEPADL